jgi:hypothetical protein
VSLYKAQNGQRFGAVFGSLQILPKKLQRSSSVEVGKLAGQKLAVCRPRSFWKNAKNFSKNFFFQ